MLASPEVGPEKVRVALEAAGQAVFECCPVTGLLGWVDSVAGAHVLGIESGVAPASSSDFLYHLAPDAAVQRETAVQFARTRGEAYIVEYELSATDGPHWVEERGSWMRFGAEERLIAVIRRIDSQKHREEALSYLAAFDDLTGQLNRSRFKQILDDTLDAVHAGTRTAAVLMVGIDDVGTINSDFGFDVADQVIVEVATRLRDVLKDDDVLGRVAGTKFGIILHEGTAQAIRDTARRIMTAMRANVVLTRSGGIAISACIGASILSVTTKSSAAAMAQCEAAFDMARRKGASSFEAFTEATETVSRRRKNVELSDVILTALNDRRVYLVYQPIVPDLHLPCTKYECLVRMRADDGSEVPAPAFIPAAERLGLIHLLDRRVLELATQALLVAGEIQLAVNVSWETVRDPVWAEGYIAHLRANRHVAHRLTIELTETQMVDAIESSIEFVAAIKELGCQFAIDDFGAGYTSFRNLKALDIDVLKIDGSFVSGVSTSRENQLFVRTLLDLARNFGLKTVAEWVDNEADAQLLKALGVDYLQGFHIGRPAARPEWSAPAALHLRSA